MFEASARRCVQRLTGYRTFETYDALADAGGVFLGWIAAPPRLPGLLRSIEARSRGGESRYR